MRCEGAACDVVEVTWDGLISAYRVKNCGTRRVCVVLTSAAREIGLFIEPRCEVVVYLEQFELPYEASFCE